METASRKLTGVRYWPIADTAFCTAHVFL